MFKVMDNPGLPDSPILIEMLDRGAMRDLMRDHGLPTNLRPIQPTDGQYQLFTIISIKLLIPGLVYFH